MFKKKKENNYKNKGKLLYFVLENLKITKLQNLYLSARSRIITIFNKAQDLRLKKNQLMVFFVNLLKKL